MKRLGVFGGSFNPIHNGHIGLVKAAQKQFMLDKVLLIPCKIPPHKLAPELALPLHRIEMCRISCNDDNNIEVSDIEFNMPEPSYTFDTICELRRSYPDYEIFLIIGADMLLTFDKWYKWQELGAMVTILAGGRMHGQNDALEQKASELNRQGLKVLVFNTDIIELSSTDIRLLIKEGIDITNLVPISVKEYINSNGLYSKLEETV